MQSREPTNIQADQASRLRELAVPGPWKIRPDVVPIEGSQHNPRVVLISEFPAMHGGFLLAWHLAKLLAADDRRTAIIDLAPSASRLPMHLQKLGETPASVLQACQPLWSDTPLGRGLANWKMDSPSNIDLVAQPAGQFPTADQMPRIVEQLLRTISGRSGFAGRDHRCAWSNIILLSDAHGVPLDDACWQAADAIVMLLPESATFCEQAQTALTARIPHRSEHQRRLLLWKQSAPFPWMPGRPSDQAHRRLLDVDCTQSFRMRWPQDTTFASSAARRSSRPIAKAAVKLAAVLERISLPPRVNLERPTGKTG